MPLGLFLFLFFLRALYFFRGHFPQTSGFLSAKQIPVASFATQARACILSGHNILHPEGRENNGGCNAPGLFLVFFLVTSPRLPVVARPNKYSS